MSDIADKIASRRTFAIISHPDAGKTTLTEKLLLYTGSNRRLAGSVKGKNRPPATRCPTGWTSRSSAASRVTSSVLQFTYDGCCDQHPRTPPATRTSRRTPTAP